MSSSRERPSPARRWRPISPSTPLPLRRGGSTLHEADLDLVGVERLLQADRNDRGIVDDAERGLRCAGRNGDAWFLRGGPDGVAVAVADGDAQRRRVGAR